MELNQFLFPAPSPSYSSAGFIGEIIYVPKYARNTETGEAIQFSDPTSETNPENREQTAAILDPDSPLIRQESSFRKSVLGGESIGFTKEELVMRNIRGELNNEADELKPSGSSKALNSYEKHVKKLNDQKDKALSINELSKSGSSISSTGFVPCLYLPYLGGSSKLLIYFHGNAEDVGLAMELLAFVKDMLKVHVLAMEYPGYGVYDGEPDAD